MSKQEIDENPPCPLCGEPMSTIIPDEGTCNKYSCCKHGEFNEVKILMPKNLILFLKRVETNLEKSIEQYLELSLIHTVRADIETQDTFAPSFQQIVEKYELGKIYRADIAGLSVLSGPDC